MKKLLIASLLAVTLFSCKKDEASKAESPNQEKKALTISVADFIQVQENMKVATGREVNSQNAKISDGLSGISHVYYIAYSSNGEIVNSLHQDTISNKTNFGIISDSLLPGSYTIVLIASEESISVYTSNGNWNTNISNDHGIGPVLVGAMGVIPLRDVFYKKIQVEVTPTGNPDELYLDLNRIVGSLEVDILDAPPANSENGFVQVKILPIPMIFKFATESVSTPDALASWSAPRINQTTFLGFLPGSNHEFTVTINYKDKVTGADLHKTIEHVVCNTNKKTIIKGYLYGVPNKTGGPDYKISLNQEWDTNSNLIEF